MQKYLMLLIALLVVVAPINAQQDEADSLRDLASRNDFHIGAAVYTYHLDDPIHAEVLSREFNLLTPEHEAKFCEIQKQQGVFDFRNFDELVAFAEANDMAIHGHTLLWHSCTPAWVENGDFSREEAIQIMRDHIMTVVGRYKGRVATWDVVNEAIDGGAYRDTVWYRLIGEEYVELAFQFAHEADPDALLFYNDYGAEGLNTKSNKIYRMVSGFVERGIPIHGVGLQTHLTLEDTSNWLTPENLDANMNRLGELGLEVHITEMDVRYQGETTDEILQKQAADFHRVLETCLENAYCNTFIVWGVTDKFSWVRDPQFYSNPTVEPLLFSDDYEPKPAYFALLDALARASGAEPILSDADLGAMLGVEERIEVEIPEPSFSETEQLAPDSFGGAVYYAAFPVSITLDDDLSDWENIPRVTVDTGPTLPANNDTSFSFAAAADDTNLYFMADVTDSKVVYGSHSTEEWYLEDSVEFYINATGDLETTAYQDGIAQIGIMAASLADSGELFIGGGNSASSGVEVNIVETESGYQIEASIPLQNDVWSITPEHLGVLGFQAHLNGSSADTRDTKLIWSVYDTQDQSWTNPSVFGQLIFWDTNN